MTQDTHRIQEVVVRKMVLLHDALHCNHARDDVIDHKPLVRGVLPRLFDRRLAVEFVVLARVSLEI